MESSMINNSVCLKLSNDETIILFDWLSRFNECDHASLFQDQAEERILFDMEAILEKCMNEIFDSDYKQQLLEAREKIRDHMH
ncbi:MAG: hypothetical protein H0T62_04880 [Parachlamydiaceae bacterium]|nr:hypothetical protein [Parachlamydiaceae bacterium]